jgi:hypothetical protein
MHNPATHKLINSLQIQLGTSVDYPKQQYISGKVTPIYLFPSGWSSHIWLSSPIASK